MSGHGASVSSESPDKQRMLRKKKIKDTSYTSIKGKESIKVTYNPIKRSKEVSIPDVEQNNNKKNSTIKKKKEDYIGDTNENMRGYDASPSETDGCVRNLVKEHENEEDEEYSELLLK